MITYVLVNLLGVLDELVLAVQQLLLAPQRVLRGEVGTVRKEK